MNYPPVRCNAPHLSTIVEVDGSLRPCYFLPTMGKVNGTPLREAINTPEALDLRRAYRRGSAPSVSRASARCIKGRVHC